MLLFVVQRKKIYIAAGILVCLCAAFFPRGGMSGRNMSVDAFLTSSYTEGQNEGQVEIFDIEKGLVIGSYSNNETFRREACKCLGSITGMYGNIKVFPKTGFIVKIPMEPPVKASLKLLAAAGIEYIENIYVILPSQGKPYLLLLDGQSKPFCFYFDADASALQKLCKQK